MADGVAGVECSARLEFGASLGDEVAVRGVWHVHRFVRRVTNRAQLLWFAWAIWRVALGEENMGNLTA